MELAISCDNLHKTYQHVKAVNGISFSVEPGRVVGLLGPNGAEKTSTVKILTTVSRPDSGTAYVCGYDIVHESMMVRKMIGVVPQSVWLNHYLSLKDNLLVYLLLHGISWREAKQKTTWAMATFGLDKYARFRCEELSGGLRRRAQVARVLASNARCFFLDEPSVGLDPSTKLSFWEQLGYLVRQSGATTFITTHSMDEVEALCDDVILINNGIVVASGSVQQLLHEVGETEVHIELGAILKIPLENTFRRKLPDVKMEQNSQGDLLTFHLRDSQRSLPQILQILTNNDINIKTLKVMPPRFEDVYLRLVGETPTYSEKAKEGEAI